MVESLPGNRFPDFYLKCFVSVFECFVSQKQHGDVELESESFPEGSPTVKPVGVASVKINWHHIALRFDALGNEGFVPRQIVYHPLFPS